MKRSEINKAYLDASSCFKKNNWYLPPNPKWDITDFGLGEFPSAGLVLVNLAQEKEYCEKLMYAKKNQATPLHYHKLKKEDIICRNGVLALILFEENYDKEHARAIKIKINGALKTYVEGSTLILKAGERITINPLLWHTFFPVSDDCIIGEVSTANDDLTDNFFENNLVGRFPEVIEDEKKKVNLLSDL